MISNGFSHMKSTEERHNLCTLRDQKKSADSAGILSYDWSSDDLLANHRRAFLTFNMADYHG